MLGWLSALGDIGANVMGNLLNYSSAQGTNKTMRYIAQKNREWMERMSNTAHQREVKDLRSAGLNPILSVGNLGGASTPSVSTDASQIAPSFNFGKPGSSLMKGLSSAKQIDNLSADTALKNEQARQASSSSELNRANTLKALSENHFLSKTMDPRVKQEIARGLQSELLSTYFQNHSAEAMNNLRERMHNEARPGQVSKGVSGRVSTPFGSVGFGFNSSEPYHSVHSARSVERSVRMPGSVRRVYDSPVAPWIYRNRRFFKMGW